LKRILPIVSFILLIAIHSQGQSTRPAPATDGTTKIVKLYPNPATSYINFDLQGQYQRGLTLHIYNGLLGRKMFDSPNVPEKFTINLNDFGRGVYIYHLIDATGRVIETGKFQVSR